VWQVVRVVVVRVVEEEIKTLWLIETKDIL
jgi:hypothetical protein